MSQDGALSLTALADGDRSSRGLKLGVFLFVGGLHVGLGTLALVFRASVPLAAPEAPVLMVDLAPLAEAASPAPAPMADEPEPDDSAPEPEPLSEPTPTPEPLPPPPEPDAPPEVRPPPKPDPVVRPEPPRRPRPEVSPPRQAPPQPRAAAAPAPDGTAARVSAPPAATVQTWQGKVSAHLERRKKYPAQARSRGQEGTARIRIVIDRSGAVLSSVLESSSGSPALDREAVELARRASPLPAPPDEIRGATLDLVVPVRFNLR